MIVDARLRVIAAAQPYPLLFATISGAHLYGFPSPDSDYDLRGAHILPVEEVIGLDQGRETIETSEVWDGLDLDLVTHDIRKFCTLLLKRNGYVLEQLYSPLVVVGAEPHDELRAIATGCITRRQPTSRSAQRQGRSARLRDPQPPHPMNRCDLHKNPSSPSAAANSVVTAWSRNQHHWMTLDVTTSSSRARRS